MEIKSKKSWHSKIAVCFTYLLINGLIIIKFLHKITALKMFSLKKKMFFYLLSNYLLSKLTCLY